MKNIFLVVMALLLPVVLLYAETGDITITGTGEEYYGVRVNIPFGKKYDYNDILVTRVIDGATLKLADGALVRLIGVQVAPVKATKKLKEEAAAAGKDYQEIVSRGVAAQKFTGQLVLKKHIRLGFDKRTQDEDGRLLAYVYVKRVCTLKDNFVGKLVHGDVLLEEHANHTVELFVNAQILKAGHGNFISAPPNTTYDEVLKDALRFGREMQK